MLTTKTHKLKNSIKAEKKRVQIFKKDSTPIESKCFGL